MPQGDVHTIHRDGRWFNEVDGNERASSSHDTKEEAVARGRELATNNTSEHTIHNLDGTIAEKNSHGNDPRSIPG